MWNATAFPFYAAFADNPISRKTTVDARMLVPQSDGVYKDITPSSEEYHEDETVPYFYTKN
jgi:hypothetical protein